MKIVVKALIALFVIAIIVHTVPGIAAEDPTIKVLNPGIAGTKARRLPLSPRLDTLEGKTIYMVDNQWGGPEGAYQLMVEMQAWFEEHMPNTTVVLRRTEGNMFTDDPALWAEIKENGDAAIIGTGQ